MGPAHDLPELFRRRPGENAAEHARRLLAHGAPADAPARWGAASQMARRLVQRVGRHESHYQRALAEALLDALAETAVASSDRLISLEVAVGPLLAAAPAEEAGGDVKRAERLGRLLAEPRLALGRPGAIELATDVGDMLFPANDEVVTPFVREYGYWEAEEVAELRSLLRPGMTFVDIGAHVGYLTLVAARAIGPTGRGIAVEPAPANFALLAANLHRRGAAMVEAVHAAAWDRSGQVDLALSPTNSGDHRATRREPTPGRTGKAGTVTVDAVALDDLLPPGATVDVVKVDTQGTDHRAISGMAATLARSGATLLVEFWPYGIEHAGDRPADVLQQYADMGFSARVLGEQPRPTTSPAADVLAAAAAAPGGFCTLVLEPVARVEPVGKRT